MISHVAFLRAINVGGHRISNADLGATVASLGFGNVSVYQASGNVLLAAADEDTETIADRLTSGLSTALGYDVPAVVRSATEVQAIVDADPFPGERPPEASTPQIMLLAGPVLDLSVVEGFATEEDRLAVVGNQIHWWPREGISASELKVASLERAVGTMTVRTAGTIQRIAKKVGR